MNDTNQDSITKRIPFEITLTGFDGMPYQIECDVIAKFQGGFELVATSPVDQHEWQFEYDGYEIEDVKVDGVAHSQFPDALFSASEILRFDECCDRVAIEAGEEAE